MVKGLVVLLALSATFAVRSGAATIDVVAGGGIGDGLPATEAPVAPAGIAVDAAGNVYLSDSITVRVRRVDAATGVIETVIGNDERGFCGYDGPGTDICLSQPRGMTVGPDGALYVTDLGTVRRWDPLTGMASRLAGRAYYDSTPCVPGFPMAEADACIPAEDVGIESSTGAAFVLAPSARRVFRVDPVTRLVSVYAGVGIPQNFVCGEGGPAINACLGFVPGMGMGADGAVYLAVSSDSPRIWRIDPATKLIERVVGGGTAPACSGDDIPATDACVSPGDVAVAPNGDLFIASSQDGLERVDAATQRLTHVPNGGGGGPIALDSAGRIYTASTGIDRFDPTTGERQRIAGNGTLFYCGDGGAATAACLSPIQEIAVDGDGNLFIADTNEFGLRRLRRVEVSTGIISTLATDQDCALTPGSDPPGLCFGDSFRIAAGLDGQLVAADVADDGAGNTISRVSLVDPATGARTTIAGLCTRSEPSGIPAIDACLGDVRDVAVDADGNVFIAEAWRVLRVDAATRLLEVVAGSGVACTPTPPDGRALAACLPVLRIAVGPPGTLLMVTNSSFDLSDRVVALDLERHRLTTVAGSGQACAGPLDDGQPATAGCLTLAGLAADAVGNVFVANNGRVRKVSALTGVITTLAGRPPDAGFEPCCDGCSGPPACMRAVDLGIDATGRVYTAEPDRREVRRITVDCDQSGSGAVACICPAELDAAACDGQTVPASLAKVVARGCLLAATSAEQSDHRRARRALHGAAKQLHAALRYLRLARRRAMLSDVCVDALEGLLQAPADRADQLLHEP
jgi:hypothetical protein